MSVGGVCSVSLVSLPLAIGHVVVRVLKLGCFLLCYWVTCVGFCDGREWL